jgi:site-specific DNA-methyltransferase (cytosine-N4-specific)
MPAPAEWVTVRRVRLTPSVEQIYWLSKHPHPKADNRRVLRAYSAAMRRTLAAGGEARQRRPSGHDRVDGAFGHDRGGSIAHTLLTLPNTASNSPYLRACRARGLPIHPARFPDGLPEFFIRLLTDEGDVVWDPCGGSGVTAEVCERLGRHWITSERSLTYVEGSATRFDEHLGFTRHLAVP